jgi:magnesium-transporting ATPase (P-type)
MDTLAALAFGGEPALQRFMREKPKRRNESVVSSYMWNSILTGSFLSFGLGLFLLMSSFGKSIFRPDVSDKYLLTGYFAFFIFISVFNSFNARTEKHNLFDNINKNKRFLQIITVIVVVQILLTYFGGVVFKCYGLTLKEWLFVIGLAFIIIPVDLIRKSIVMKHCK